jgi:hypothetical protein
MSRRKRTGAMGLVLALSPLLFLMARTNDRTAPSASANASEANRRSPPQSHA